MKTLSLSLLLTALLSAPAAAQNWRRIEITETDRERPCLVQWQRTLDDAEAISRDTGRPLLICVNMDGEAASEAFANYKYKTKNFAELTERFVAVIASPNRHTPDDHGPDGARIPCPRFGMVTCGEHLALEPVAYERYFEGQRYAPRHIGVSPKGDKLFDHYLNQNLSVVDSSLEQHGIVVETKREHPLDARVLDRREQEYLTSGYAHRMRLLRAAKRSDAPALDLIRLGLNDAEPRARSLAARMLAELDHGGAIELVFDALKTGAAEEANRALRKKLTRLSADEPRARRAARILEGLAERSRIVPLPRWKRALSRGGPEESALAKSDVDELLQRLDVMTRADDGAAKRPECERQLEISRTCLAVAKARMRSGSDPTFFLVDARNAAVSAIEAGADRYAGQAVQAEASYLLSEFDRAAELAEKALPYYVDHATHRDAADLLEVFARVRTSGIYVADGNGEDWPATWLSDADSAYRTLEAHPLASADPFVKHSELLSYLGLEQKNGEVLRAGLGRFPLNAELHRRYRDHVWASRGPRELEHAYERVDFGEKPGVYAWFRGYATFVYAEHLYRAKEHDAAHAAYERAVRLFEQSSKQEPEYRESAEHYIALAQSSLAFDALRTEDLQRGFELIVASIERSPTSLRFQDGLGRTPLLAYERLAQRLERAGKVTLREELERRVIAAVPDLAQPEVAAPTPPAPETPGRPPGPLPPGRPPTGGDGAQ